MNTAVVRHNKVAISLHWLIALLIFVGWGMGFYMANLPFSPAKLRYFNWHKWIGVTVFLLVVIRTAWRATHQPPPLPDSIPRWQVQAVGIGHAVLYVLMWALPLTGWLLSSAKGFQTVYFGVLPLPDLIHKDKALGDLLEDVHASLAWVLAALVVIHMTVALKHYFVDRDQILQRMLP